MIRRAGKDGLCRGGLNEPGNKWSAVVRNVNGKVSNPGSRISARPLDVEVSGTVRDG